MLALDESQCTENDIRRFTSSSGRHYEMRIYAGTLRRGPNFPSPLGMAPIGVAAAVASIYEGQQLIGIEARERFVDVRMPDGTVVIWDQALFAAAQLILEQHVVAHEGGAQLPDDHYQLV